MREFLDLSPTQALNSLADRFPTERVLCMVGTDSKDYTAAAGMSRRAVGPLSDGLVTIENAVVRGAPRAFVHRSHSGHYGVVNSESCYQNLTRFLFGNIRIDGTLIIEELSLPKKVQDAHDAGKQVRASYHFETVVRVRGQRWDLHRRLVDEGSAIFRQFDELFRAERPRHPHLFSTFLALSKRNNTRRKSLGFAVADTGKPVYIKVGRFGPYVQLGDAEEGSKKKPKMVSLFGELTPDNITFEDALRLLTLPRNLGQDQSGVDVLAHYGRFGPYIKRGSDTRSLQDHDDERLSASGTGCYCLEQF